MVLNKEIQLEDHTLIGKEKAGGWENSLNKILPTKGGRKKNTKKEYEWKTNRRNGQKHYIY